MRPLLKIFLLMSPVVIEGNNLYNLCMAPAPAPAPCIAVSLYRFLVVAVMRHVRNYTSVFKSNFRFSFLLNIMIKWGPNLFKSMSVNIDLTKSGTRSGNSQRKCMQI